MFWRRPLRRTKKARGRRNSMHSDSPYWAARSMPGRIRSGRAYYRRSAIRLTHWFPVFAIFFALAMPALALPTPADRLPPLVTPQIDATVQKGLKFLASKQGSDGAFRET